METKCVFCAKSSICFYIVLIFIIWWCTKKTLWKCGIIFIVVLILSSFVAKQYEISKIGVLKLRLLNLSAFCNLKWFFPTWKCNVELSFLKYRTPIWSLVARSLPIKEHRGDWRCAKIFRTSTVSEQAISLCWAPNFIKPRYAGIQTNQIWNHHMSFEIISNLLNIYPSNFFNFILNPHNTRGHYSLDIN